jgi:TRAP transporter TAXI family solute receptor
MNKKYDNLYTADIIPKTTYAGMTADNKAAAVANILIAHEKLSDQAAYNIVKTIFDKRQELINVHKAAQDFKLETQKASATPVPYHPGAIKYFKEKGVKLD